MTIEDIHRARWRKLFSRATREPWAGSFGKHEAAVVAAQSGDIIATGLAIPEAEFIAESRAGWPAALDALEQAEADLARTKDSLIGLVVAAETLEAKVERLLSSYNEACDLLRTCQNRGLHLLESATALESALARSNRLYTELRDACAAWKSNRYAPALLRVIEEHLK